MCLTLDVLARLRAGCCHGRCVPSLELLPIKVGGSLFKAKRVLEVLPSSLDPLVAVLVIQKKLVVAEGSVLEPRVNSLDDLIILQ